MTSIEFESGLEFKLESGNEFGFDLAAMIRKLLPESYSGRVVEPDERSLPGLLLWIFEFLGLPLPAQNQSDTIDVFLFESSPPGDVRFGNPAVFGH